jgi:hypothetical protein
MGLGYRENDQNRQNNHFEQNVYFISSLGRQTEVVKQVPEKALTSGAKRENHTSGAKAPFILLSLPARLKPWPDTKPLRESFSATCKTTGHSAGFMPGMNPRPTARMISSASWKSRSRFADAFCSRVFSTVHWRKDVSRLDSRRAKPY